MLNVCILLCVSKLEIKGCGIPKYYYYNLSIFCPGCAFTFNDISITYQNLSILTFLVRATLRCTLLEMVYNPDNN
jgi:hypothetical protein